MVDTRGMLDQAFPPLEVQTYAADRIGEEVRDAFAIGESIHEEVMDNDPSDAIEEDERGDDEHPPEVDVSKRQDVPNFNPTALEESLENLYDGARCSKLVATILLMNLCTVHGSATKFANELFNILHLHLLPENNTLPRSHFAAKSLTVKLGLMYNSIYTCERGCVLFRGPYENDLQCPKCGGRRYRDEERRCFPLKVLRHFPIIPQLQRMFMSLALCKLMVWHAENRSNKDGGDGLVRHPCDSKAW